MVRLLLLLTSIISLLLTANANASFCPKKLQISIKMDDAWYEKEQLRLENEDALLKKYSKYISKKSKPLIPEPYRHYKGDAYDHTKNCQMEKDVSNISEIEYAMNIDSGIRILKSYCSTIGKCIGYNDFLHDKRLTASEDRLIDIREDNAIFYHYFYSAQSESYEPLFNITNFHTGYEIYLNDTPNFSPDNRVILEVRSIAKKDSTTESASEFPREFPREFPVGFNINIYERNDLGEYINVEPAKSDPENPDKISTFLSRNPSCGETPHFHSWRNNHEARLSMLPPHQANDGIKVILSYDKKSKKWGCKQDLFPEYKCESYLPNSLEYSSNISKEQINNCTPQKTTTEEPTINSDPIPEKPLLNEDGLEEANPTTSRLGLEEENPLLIKEGLLYFLAVQQR
jgi:hypothetical protein